MMENEIGRLHIGHVIQMDLHVDAADGLRRCTCIGVDCGIAIHRHNVDGMSRYHRRDRCQRLEHHGLIIAIQPVDRCKVNVV